MFAAKANNPEAVRLLLDKEGGKRMLRTAWPQWNTIARARIYGVNTSRQKEQYCMHSSTLE